MKITYWFLASCEQTSSGYWRIKPNVVLPQGTYLRYFYPDGDKSVALVRITHETEAKLDEIEQNQNLKEEIVRLDRSKTWEDIKSVLSESLLTKMNINTNLLANDELNTEIIDGLLATFDEDDRRSTYINDEFVIEK